MAFSFKMYNMKNPEDFYYLYNYFDFGNTLTLEYVK